MISRQIFKLLKSPPPKKKDREPLHWIKSSKTHYKDGQLKTPTLLIIDLITCTCQRDHDDHILGAALGQRFLQILEKQAVPLHLLAYPPADPHILQ